MDEGFSRQLTILNDLRSSWGSCERLKAPRNSVASVMQKRESAVAWINSGIAIAMKHEHVQSLLSKSGGFR